MLKAILPLFFGCIIFNTVAAYGDDGWSRDRFDKPYLHHPDRTHVYIIFPPKLLDDGFMATKIPPAWKPFVTSSYVLLGENNSTYLDTIKKSVKINWDPPLCPTTSIVSLKINKKGAIEEAKMLCPSGNQQYDQAALKAVFHAHHFACPPKNLRLPVLITLTFNSNPRLTDAGSAWDPSHLTPHYFHDGILIAPQLKTKQSK